MPQHTVDGGGNLVEKEHASWWDKHWLQVCLAFLFAWTTLGFYLGANEHSSRVDQAVKFSQDLRAGLVKSCDTNGNPLREAVQRILRNEIKQSESPLIYQIFPQIPRETLEKLIAEQNDERREIIAEITPVNCEKQYPEDPGK